jgi:hypothetical protein
LRISFGIIWLIDAILKWLPVFRAGCMGTIMRQARGSPAGSGPGFDWGGTTAWAQAPGGPGLGFR